MIEGNVPFTLTEEERRRAEVVDHLSAEGPDAVPRLIELLTDPSWTVRRSVVASLASLGEAAIGPLCDVLRNRRDDETRLAAAVDALVASSTDVEPALRELAGGAPPPVLADIAQILGRRRASHGVPLLVQMLGAEDDNVGVAAIEALGNIGGSAAVDSLVSAVNSGNFFRTFPAIDVLGRSGDPRAVAPLAALLGSSHYSAEAARALGRTGDRNAVTPLTTLFSRPGEANVRLAAISLVDLHQRHRERFGSGLQIEESFRRAAPPRVAVRRLVRAIPGADPLEQRAIARCLGFLEDDAAVPALTRLLDAPPPVGPAAAESLSHLGRHSDSELRAAIREGTSARRRVLLPLVTRSPALDEVVACLEDPDPDVRALACEAISRIGSPRAVRFLFPLLRDPSRRVTHAATAAIQSLGAPETKSLAMEAARSADPAERRAGLGILAYFGYPDALDVLLGALQDEEATVRDVAIQGLPLIDAPRARETLLGLARDPATHTRAMAMRALADASSDSRVQAALVRGLADEDPWVRYYACRSLGRVSPEGATRAITRLLDDPAGQVRVAAIESLAQIPGEEAFEALRGAASSDEPEMRRAALVGLGMARRPEALPLLLHAAESPDVATRLMALSALAGFGSPEVMDALENAASDPDEAIRSAAIGFLAASPAAEATAVLIRLLRSSDNRDLALAALCAPVEIRIPPLLSELGTADDELAGLLTSVLARMDRTEALDALREAAHLPNRAARKAAVTTLAGIGTPEAVLEIKRVAKEDTDPEVRRLCALLLST